MVYFVHPKRVIKKIVNLTGFFVLSVVVFFCPVAVAEVLVQGQITSTDWVFEEDIAPVNQVSQYDTLNLEISVQNTSNQSRAYRLVIELVEKIKDPQIKDWLYAGPSYIGGLLKENDLAQPGFGQDWGQVQNTFLIPPDITEIYQCYISLSAPAAETSLGFIINLYDVEGNLIDKFDSLDNPRLGFILKAASGDAGDVKKNACAWVNTNQPVYYGAEPIVVETAIIAADNGEPIYLPSWDNLEIKLLDLTKNQKLIDTFTLGDFIQRRQVYDKTGSTLDKFYSLVSREDQAPLTYYIELAPEHLNKNKGLEPGHEYALILQPGSGRADMKTSVEIEEAFTYLAVPEPEDITISRELSGDRTGQHKVPPLVVTSVTLTVEVSAPIFDVVFIDCFPKSWTVVDAGEGIVSEYNSDYNQIVWNKDSVEGTLNVSYELMSPERTMPPTKYYFEPELRYNAGVYKGDSWMVVVSDPVNLGSSTIAPTSSTVTVGEIIDYTVTVINSGNVDANLVSVTDDMPAPYLGSLTVLTKPVGSTDNSTATKLDVSGFTVVKKVGSTPGTQTITFRVTANSQTAGTSHQVTIKCGSDTWTPGTAKADVIINAAAAPAFTACTKTSQDVNGGSLAVGDTIKYTITVLNNGGADATGVVVTDTIPTQTTYKNGSADNGGTYDSDNKKLTWNIGNLAKDANTILTYQVTVNSGATGTITNTASVDSNETSPVNTTEASNTVGGVAGRLRVTESVLAIEASNAITVTVEDADLKGNSTLSVSMEDNGGETETLTLNETPAGSGKFTGSIGTKTTGSSANGDGVFRVSDGDTITTTYNDALPAGTKTDVTKIFSSGTATTGTVAIVNSTYSSNVSAVAANGTLYIKVVDSDVSQTSGGSSANDNVWVTITTTAGDSELLNIPESATAGEFRGSITTSLAAYVQENGTLQLAAGDIITVTYKDALDASDLANQSRTDTATVITATGTANIVGEYVLYNAVVTLEVTDADLDTAGTDTVSVTVQASNGNSVSKTLTETGIAGDFSGTVNLTTLAVTGGEIITLTYVDASPSGNRTDTATVVGKTGVVNITRNYPWADQPMEVTVIDADLVGAGTVKVSATTKDTWGTDLDSLKTQATLTETPADSGYFTGSIPTNYNYTFDSGNNTLEVIETDEVTVTYTDADPAGARTDTAEFISGTGKIDILESSIKVEVTTINLEVRDTDISGGTAPVTVTTTNGDSVSLNLTETTDTGIFKGTLSANPSNTPVTTNSILEIKSRDYITLTYVDASYIDPTDGSSYTNGELTDTCRVGLEIKPIVVNPMRSIQNPDDLVYDEGSQDLPNLSYAGPVTSLEGGLGGPGESVSVGEEEEPDIPERSPAPQPRALAEDQGPGAETEEEAGTEPSSGVEQEESFPEREEPKREEKKEEVKKEKPAPARETISLVYADAFGVSQGSVPPYVPQVRNSEIIFDTDQAMFGVGQLYQTGRTLSGLSQDIQPDIMSGQAVSGQTQIDQLKTRAYGLSNLISLSLYSGLGLALDSGPLVVKEADLMNMPAKDFLTQKLRETALDCGLGDIPDQLQPVFAEFASGRPVSQQDSLSWDKSGRQDNLSPGVLGQSLLSQALFAGEFSLPDNPDTPAKNLSGQEKFLGRVLPMIMANKIEFINTGLCYNGQKLGAVPEPQNYNPKETLYYFPHLIRSISRAEVKSDAGGRTGTGNNAAVFKVEDASSHLFDQISLLEGLSQVLNYSRAQKQTTTCDMKENVLKITALLFNNLKYMHFDSRYGTLVDIYDGKNNKGTISTINAGLTVSGLAQLKRSLADNISQTGDDTGSQQTSSLVDIEEVSRLIRQQADFIMNKLKDPAGGVYNSYLLETDEADRSSKTLAAQSSAMGALAEAYAITGESKYLEEAGRLFEYLENMFWDKGLGIYKSDIDAVTYVYSPLNTGLCLGALRQLLANADRPLGAAKQPKQSPLGEDSMSAQEMSSYRQLLLSRMGSFINIIFDEAGLQLSGYKQLKKTKDIVRTWAPNERAPVPVSGEKLAVFDVLDSEIKIDPPLKSLDDKYRYDVAGSMLYNSRFTTDMCMFGAGQLYQTAQTLSGLSQDIRPDIMSNRIRPGQIQISQYKTRTYGLSNLIALNLYSGLGLGLDSGPLVAKEASLKNMSAKEFLTQQLKESALACGLSDIPSQLQPVFAEFTSGQPLKKQGSLTWEKTGIQKKLSPGSLGQSLFSQALVSTEFSLQDSPDIPAKKLSGQEKFLGRVLSLIMANKIEFINTGLCYNGQELSAIPEPKDYDPKDKLYYFPHLVQVSSGADTGSNSGADMNSGNSTVVLKIEDASSHLFDQLSLLAGLSQVLNYSRAQKQTTTYALKENALKTAAILFKNLEYMHFDDQHRTLVNTHDGKSRGHAISAINAGLAVSVLTQLERYLNDASSVMVDDTGSQDSAGKEDAPLIAKEEVSRLIRSQADFIIDKLKDPAGGVYNSYLLERDEADRSSKALASQSSAMGALVDAYAVTNESKYLEEAGRLFEYLEKMFWDEELDVYKSNLGARTYTYSPVNTGLCLGALRQLLVNADNLTAENTTGLPVVSVAVPARGSMPRAGGGCRPLTKHSKAGSMSAQEPGGYRQLFLSRIGSLVNRIFDEAGLQTGIDNTKPAVLYTTIGLVYPIHRDTGQIAVQKGNNIDYEITVANPANITARDIKIMQTLPEGLKHIAGSGRLNGTGKDPEGDNPYIWNLGDLERNSEFILRCQFQVTDEAPLGKNIITTAITETNIAGTASDVDKFIEEIYIQASRLQTRRNAQAK